MHARRRIRSLIASASLALGVGVAAIPLAFAGDKIIHFPGVDAAPRDASVSRIPPDPTPPSRARKQWVFDLRWSKGEVFLIGVHALDLGASQETPRAMGRFALELFEGPTLIERVRFDFPLLGAGEPLDAGHGSPPRFGPKLTTRIGVMFPALNKGNRLELWDRATDQRWPLPWPPEDTDAKDGGTSSTDGGTK